MFLFPPRALLVAPVLLTLAAGWPSPAADELLVYFGTYTGAKSKGIYVSRLDVVTGTLSAPQLAAEARNPSFLAVRSQGDYLYAVNEIDTFGGKPAGSVSAFAINKVTGILTPLNQARSAGAGPAHLSLDASGRNVLVANYRGGSIAVLPIARDGKVGAPLSFVQHTGSSVNPERQRQPHAHQIIVDPSNRFAYVADLGIDKMMIYRFDAAKPALAAATPPSAAMKPGAGPRHAAISAAGQFVYVINELDCTVAVFRREASTGGLDAVQTVSSLPPGVKQEKTFSTAEVALSPSGSVLYGSNRGHDSISVFAVDKDSGRLTFIANTPTGGKTPRGFAIEPGGHFLIAANQHSDSVVVFAIDRATGKLSSVGAITVDTPVDVKIVKP